MTTPFPRTVGWLSRDAFTAGHLALGAIALLIGAWIAWAMLADVGVYAVSKKGRLVVEQEAHPVEAVLGGTVVSVGMRLGDDIRAGDVLLDLDDTSVRRRLEEAAARRSALGGQLVLVHEEIVAAEATLSEARKALESGERAAEADLGEARAAAQLALAEAERQAELHAKQVVSAAALERAQAEAAQCRAEAVAVAARSEQTRRELRTGLGEREVDLIHLRREAERLRGEVEAAEAAAVRLAEEVERHRICAPVDGRLAQVAQLQPGAVLEQGERVASVLPSGEVRAVADFSPAEALGRIRPGQRAWVSLEAFPWTRYGYVEATVERVAAEPGGGVVRVELELASSSSRAPLEHGLPGTVEVEVERVAPWQLLLRRGRDPA